MTQIFCGPDLEQALHARKAFAAKCGQHVPTAWAILARDLDDCLTFCRFPQVHWKRLRTSNLIQRAFREVRRQTNVVARVPGETAALGQDRLTW